MSFGNKTNAAALTSLNLLPDFIEERKYMKRAARRALSPRERIDFYVAEAIAFFDPRQEPDQAPFRIALASIALLTVIGALGFTIATAVTEPPVTPPPALRSFIFE